MERDQLLTEREKTHGRYTEFATMSQTLKKALTGGRNWLSLTDAQREALEMIQFKVARVLSGDPDFPDHWDDIAGYAKLGREQCFPVFTKPNDMADIKIPTIGGVGLPETKGLNWEMHADAYVLKADGSIESIGN